MVRRSEIFMGSLGLCLLEAGGALYMAERQPLAGAVYAAIGCVAGIGMTRAIRREGVEPAHVPDTVPENWSDELL